MGKTIKIAAIQFNSVWQSVEHNLQRVEDMVLSAAADVVVLPEMFATGFSMSPEAIAQSPDGQIVNSMSELAQRSGKALVFSAAIAENGKYYNRLFFITPEGQMSTYDKRHTFRMSGENEHYGEGHSRLVVNYKGFRFCTLICYDLRFPVFSRVVGDYDVLIYVASWPAVRSYPWSTLLCARAIENQCYVVGVNRSGDDPKEHYSGDSVVLDFLGKPMVKAEPSAEQTIVGQLSMQELEAFRAGFPAHLDADKFELKIKN